MSEVTLNGERVALRAEETVDSLVRRLRLGDRGLAVARNGEVVPRSSWPTTALVAGDVVEVLAPAQGG